MADPYSANPLAEEMRDRNGYRYDAVPDYRMVVTRESEPVTS